MVKRKLQGNTIDGSNYFWKTSWLQDLAHEE